MRVKMENDRRVFLNATAQIKQDMILGVDKNTYVEPIIGRSNGLRNTISILSRERTDA